MLLDKHLHDSVLSAGMMVMTMWFTSLLVNAPALKGTLYAYTLDAHVQDNTMKKYMLLIHDKSTRFDIDQTLKFERRKKSSWIRIGVPPLVFVPLSKLV